MTTFTRIAEDETPTISVDVKRRVSKIGVLFIEYGMGCRLTWGTDPMIYGGFMEYVAFSFQ